MGHLCQARSFSCNGIWNGLNHFWLLTWDDQNAGICLSVRGLQPLGMLLFSQQGSQMFFNMVPQGPQGVKTKAAGSLKPSSGTLLLSLPPHSVSPSGSQAKLSLKGTGNRPHLLWLQRHQSQSLCVFTLWISSKLSGSVSCSAEFLGQGQLSGLLGCSFPLKPIWDPGILGLIAVAVIRDLE